MFILQSKSPPNLPQLPSVAVRGAPHAPYPRLALPFPTVLVTLYVSLISRFTVSLLRREVTNGWDCLLSGLTTAPGTRRGSQKVFAERMSRMMSTTDSDPRNLGRNSGDFHKQTKTKQKMNVPQMNVRSTHPRAIRKQKLSFKKG